MSDRWSTPREEFDGWARCANRHLLAYVMRQASQRIYYAPDPTRILVKYKNAWAQDMRDEAVNGEVLVERQKLTWSQCMERAETEIAKARTP